VCTRIAIGCATAGTPIEDRVEFNNEWKVGTEHGIIHDGLQADGYIELRLDWKAPGKKAGEDYISKCAILRVNPWLAYGCGEGARLAIRKPGATESTASTLQRTLRDDYVVVRRDGSDSELTVDPTPFTVVPASNPRHKPGTRLLIVHEGACVDATVEPWSEGEIDTRDGSRHLMRVEGKQLSGWVTFTNASGQDILVKRDDPTDGDAANTAADLVAAKPATEPSTEAIEGAPAAEGEGEHGEDDFDSSGVWISCRKKPVNIHSGCDPTNSEKISMLTNKMPVRILERRQTVRWRFGAPIDAHRSRANLTHVRLFPSPPLSRRLAPHPTRPFRATGRERHTRIHQHNPIASKHPLHVCTE
jgi:hypothetical protein